MQFNQADSSGSNRVGVDENLINFKPSPNFKNMKKFIKFRSETTTGGTIQPTPVASHLPPPQATISNMDTNALLRPDWHSPDVQPPLPLDPPPPDDVLQVQVKQENVDTDYEPVQVSRVEHSEQMESETNEVPSKVCRDFIRGTCKREATCKYAHKYDLSQLGGVYTFCRKFQNSVCTFTNCKYVHATVFEEQNFYRTGLLPPHALQHKMNNVLQPPPPPPPEEKFVPFNMDFSNPPPPLPNSIDKPIMATSSAPVYPRYIPPTQVPTSEVSSTNRNWNNMEPMSAPPCEHAYSEPLWLNKCNHCDIMELRYQHLKNKVKKKLDSKAQLGKKTNLLDKKIEKLRGFLSMVLDPTTRMQSHSTDRSKLIKQLTAFCIADLEGLKDIAEDK